MPSLADPAALPEYAALYPRVSTDRQKDNWSVKDQLALARLGKERGLRVVLYDADLGISGGTIEQRPDMTALLRDLDAGKISKPKDVDGAPVPRGAQLAAIICVDLNRLSRDEDVVDGMTIKRFCREAGCLILTPGKVYDFDRDDDQMLAGMEFFVSGVFKQKNKKAGSRAQYQLAHSDRWPSGPAPFGYRLVFDVPHRDGRPRARLEVDPEEAAVVRLAFRLYLEGLGEGSGPLKPLSLRDVARALNARGYRFRIRFHRTKGRAAGIAPDDGTRPVRPFEEQDIRALLARRLYLGYRTWGAGPDGRGTGNRYVRDIGPAEVFKAAWRIVDPDVWLRAQAQRRERAAGARRQVVMRRALLGLLRCPHCGGGLWAEGFKRLHTAGSPLRFTSYRCGNFRRMGRDPERGCPAGGFGITEQLAVDAINAFVLEQFARVDLDAAVEAAAEEGRLARRDELSEGLRARLAENEAGRQNLVRAVERGDLASDDIRTRREELDAERSRLEGRLGALRAKTAEADEDAALAERLRGRVAEHMLSLAPADPARYRRFLGWFFASLTVVAAGDTHHRVARVVAWAPTAQGAKLLGAPGTVMSDPVHTDTHNCPWDWPALRPALSLLLPAGA